MASSDEGAKRRIGTGWLVVIAIAVVLGAGALAFALLLGSTTLSLWAFQDHAEAQHIDMLEETFRDNRASFEASTAYMGELTRSEPGVVRVEWSLHEVCVRDSVLEKVCRDSSESERALRAPSGPVVWQAKDDGRVFFSFNDDEHPRNFLMFDPQERDPKQFAREHGFTWERDLGEGWSIPGSIPDDEDYDDMWVLRAQ
jgi:hypothetical protein